MSFGYAECGEAVQDGDTDLELRDLAVEVPRHEALTQQFHTVHLRFDAASAVIAAPSSPDRPTEALRCAQGFVPCDCSGRVGLPWLGVFAGWNDCSGTPGGDGVMAFARVEGAISGDAGDLLIRRNLVEQFGQHGRIAHIAGRELRRPNFQRLLVNSDVDLAPDAAFGAAVLARVPLPFALDLDPGARGGRRNSDQLLSSGNWRRTDLNDETEALFCRVQGEGGS